MKEFLMQLTTFDYICLGILLFFIINGLLKGFIKELSGVVGLLLSVVISKIVSIPITLKLYEFFDVRGKIIYKLERIIQEVYENKIGAGVEELKEGLDTVLEKFNFIGEYISSNVKKDFGIYSVLTSNKDSLVKDLSLKLMEDIEPLVQYFLSVVVFIILFILISIIVKIIMNMLSSVIKDIPVVGSMNTLLGMCLGFIKGICFIVVINLLAFLAISIFGNLQESYVSAVLNSKTFEFISSFKYFIS